MEWKPRFTVLTLSTLTLFLSQLPRFLLPPVLPIIISEYGLSLAQAGLLMSGLFFTYAITQIPFGILSDRIGRKTVLAASMLLCSISTLFTGFAASFEQLLAIRAFSGFASAGHYSPGSSWVSENFEEKDRGRALGTFMSAISVASMSAPLIAAPLAIVIGWRSPFLLLAIPSFVLTALLFRVKSQRGQSVSSMKSINSSLMQVIKSPRIELLSFLSAMNLTLWYVLLTFLPVYLVTKFGVSLAVAGILYAVYSFSSFSGQIIAGLLSSKVRSKLIWISSTSMTAIVLILALLIVNLSIMPMLLIVLGFVVGAAVPSFMTYNAKIAPKDAKGLTFAYINTVGFAGGSLSTVFAGYLIDVQGYESCFIFLIIAAVISCVIIATLKETIAE